MSDPVEWYRTLYVVLERTPDYTSCELITAEVEDAVACEAEAKNLREIHEIDLGEVGLFLIAQGLSRKV